ncbi:MAG: creatininase family protein [Chloroflexi bacterium]|nr:creatininase family protein [Chloroflexota bacterium]
MAKSLILSQMTWEDARDALEKVELAIIPTGSFEQHGPHMTFEVDTARAVAFGKLLAERLHPRVILAPPISFGVSFHHMAFPGTITLRAETFHALIYDIVWSLREHGVKQFFFVNGHGGNRPSLEVMGVKLRHELGVHIAWSSFTALAADVKRGRVKSEITGHACEGETSQAMYLAPHVVKRDRITRGAVKGYPYKFLGKGNNGGIIVPYTFDEITANGALGDATLATEEFGKEVIDAALSKATEFLIDFMDKNRTD